MSHTRKLPNQNWKPRSSWTGSSAVIWGTVNPLGANGNYGFEWSTDSALNNPNLSCPYILYAPVGDCPAWTTNSTQQSFSYSLSGLSDATTYYFRLVGYDADNGSYWYGATLSFMTP